MTGVKAGGVHAGSPDPSRCLASHSACERIGETKGYSLPPT
jgi:hypothetical protein